MTEPSDYYPLRPLKRLSLRDAPSLEPLESVKDDTSLQLDDTLASEDTFGISPKKDPSGSPLHLRSVIKTPLEMALLPLAAVGYLAFCYTVHGRVIPVNTYGLYAVTQQHLTVIKGGITAISIVVIWIALYPVYSVISSLKSEEFFRLLVSHRHGIPLGTINHISTLSFGNFDMMKMVWRQTCTRYYMLGIVTSLLVLVVSTFAPGTLTIDSVQADGDLMAFAVGAVLPQSVLNATYSVGDPGGQVVLNSDSAASIAWAEMELGVQYHYGIANASEPDYAAYIVPPPLDLSSETTARWLSDVIGINPSCSWASTNITTPLLIPTNLTASALYLQAVYLVDFDLDVQVDGIFSSSIGTSAAVIDPEFSLTNHTNQGPVSDGSTVFLLAQCQSGCLQSGEADITFDFTGLNTTFTISFTDSSWSFAILRCAPNLEIETREVRNDGQGVFYVQPTTTQLTRQRNLNAIQTTALFSLATKSLGSSSAGSLWGNVSQYSLYLGSQVQVDLLFGHTQLENLPGSNALQGTTGSVTLTPAPVEQITQRYTLALQSVAKAYLGGYLGTAYVPGRISVSEIVFAASTPNLIISTVVFVLLAVLIVLANFREEKGVDFTLINLAAAVHGSELPERFAQLKTEQMAKVSGMRNIEAEGDRETDSSLERGRMRHVWGSSLNDDQEIIQRLGERRVFMQRRVDGLPILHIS